MDFVIVDGLMRFEDGKAYSFNVEDVTGRIYASFYRQSSKQRWQVEYNPNYNYARIMMKVLKFGTEHAKTL